MLQPGITELAIVYPKINRFLLSIISSIGWILAENSPLFFNLRNEIKYDNFSIDKSKTIMTRYICSGCYYTYDPDSGIPDHGIEPGTSFADLPDDWICPECGLGKDSFREYRE